MKPVTKKILIISTCFMGAGVLLTCAGIAAGGWPGFEITRNGLRSAATQRQPYILEKTQIENFSELDINIGSEADIILKPSGNDHFYLEYTLDGDYEEPSYGISDGTFHFTQGSSGTAINGIYFFGPGRLSKDIDPEIRLYIPESAQLSDIKIYNDYGNLSIQQVTAGNADIQADYGDIDLTDSAFASAAITLSAGDFEADSSTIDELTYINEYGDSTLLLHDPLEEYTFDLKTEYGVINVPLSAPGRLDASDIAEMTYTSQADGDKMIKFIAESGDIEVKSS